MTTTALLAAGSAATAVRLLLGGAAWRRYGDRAARRPAVALGTIGAAAVLVTGFVSLPGRQVVLVVVGLAVAGAAMREVSRRRRAADADRRSDLVLVVCDGLASDLRAGQPPVAALEAAIHEWPELAPAVSAARLGADVPATLRGLAARPGAGQLRTVAAAWQVAHRSGAGLAGALAMAADRLREDRATARVVATEMAAAQATARLLAALPVGVLLLGNGLGGDPVGFLLDTTPGLVCLCSGLALEYAGLCWLARITDVVTGRRAR